MALWRLLGKRIGSFNQAAVETALLMRSAFTDPIKGGWQLRSCWMDAVPAAQASTIPLSQNA
jgi:hypothetical protein